VNIKVSIGKQKMTQPNNPVGRLNELLVSLLNFNSETRMNDAGFYFIQNEINSEYFSAFKQLSEIIGLIEESKKAVKNIEHLDQGRYLKPLLSIEGIFSHINLHDSWNNFKKSFNEVTMTQLEYCSDAVARESQENFIESEKINDLLKDIDLLQEKLMQSSISDQLILIIFEQINNIRVSLINYKIFGVDGLRRSLESGMGAIILNRDNIINKMSETDEKPEKNIIKSFFDALSKLNTLVSLGKNTPELIESASTAIKFLLHQSG
jgi:hypothetical protein